MYQKPQIQKLGDFRTLTRIGADNCADGSTILGNATGVNICPARS